jgi:hypothetical protein
MADIFISYQSQDRERVRPLVRLLEEHGWSVWWDSYLRTGERFNKKIAGALEEARCVVVLWSKTSVESDWVISEAKEGDDKNALVPVQIDDRIKIPLAFRGMQTAGLINWPYERDEEQLHKLLNDIESVLADAGKSIPGDRDAPHEQEVKEQEIEFEALPPEPEEREDAGRTPWKKLMWYLIAFGGAALLFLSATIFFHWAGLRARNLPQVGAENHNQPVAQQYSAPSNSGEPTASDNSKRETEVSSPESTRASISNNQPAGTATRPATTSPTPVIPKTGDLASELHNPALLTKLQAAHNYAVTRESSSQEKALNLYRQVVRQLSPAARAQLNQSLLRNAEIDAEAGNTDQAVTKYGNLFASYLRTN